MDARSEVREFLTSRRAKLTPDKAGLPTFGNGPRRVPGLRREEVALLAGVSVDYYTRLERGNLGGVSETVLEALARALQLDEPERAHLFNLARAVHPTTRGRRRPGTARVRPAVQQLLDSLVGAPAYVRNGRGDILAANALGRAVYAPILQSPDARANTIRFVFLDASAPAFYDDWEKIATDAVAILHAEAGRDPFDRDLSDLVGELSTRSEPFRTRWAAHNVRSHDSGVKCFHHPVVGELTLNYERMTLGADPGLTLFVYTAEPGSKSAEALDLLASWSLPTTEEETVGDHEKQR